MSLFKKKTDNRLKGVTKIGAGNPNISLGSYSYMGKLSLYCWKDGYSLSIGRYCSLATELTVILGGEHDIDWVSTYPFISNWNMKHIEHKNTPKCRGNIVIEDDVWIGHGVTLLSGTTIGTGSVIGANTVIRGKIPPYSIVCGNPAKIIRKRFDEQLCKKLLESKWWMMDKDELSPFVEFMDQPLLFLERLSQK